MRSTWRCQTRVLAALLFLLDACIPASSTASDTVEAKDEFETAVETDPAEQFPLFGPFAKHPTPVLETRENYDSPWFCPWHQQQVLWESKDVFNPAVVVTGSPPTIKVLPPFPPPHISRVTCRILPSLLNLCSTPHIPPGTMRCTLT